MSAESDLFSLVKILHPSCSGKLVFAVVKTSDIWSVVGGTWVSFVVLVTGGVWNFRNDCVGYWIWSLISKNEVTNYVAIVQGFCDEAWSAVLLEGDQRFLDGDASWWAYFLLSHFYSPLSEHYVDHSGTVRWWVSVFGYFSKLYTRSKKPRICRLFSVPKAAEKSEGQ